MDTSSNNSVTPMVSNVEFYLSDKFDAIIDGSYFEKIRKEFEYCMGHSNFRKQFIQLLVEKRRNSFVTAALDELRSTNTKTTTDNKADEVDNATTNEFYARKQRFLQLLDMYPEFGIMLTKL